MSEEFVLDESQFTQVIRIESQYDSLKISNPSEIEVDAEALTQHLQLIEGIDQVETLKIDINSSLNDLRALRAFTNLKALFVYGQQIKSFDGIEWFSKGTFIEIQTYRNRKRDISQLAQTNVQRIYLYTERIEDYSAVAGCKYLKSIDICLSMEPNFTEWKENPVEVISFKSCKFKELGNIADVSGLKDLRVLGCRSLERITGDNSNITRLIVDSCKKLDLSTLKTFEGIEVLIVNSCAKEMNLSEIRGLKYVKHIDFILCNVQVDLINLKEYFPNIESLHISGMKKEYGLQLKQLNPDVQITSRTFEL